MSLINKMLADLEKRDAFLNDNQDMILDGLYSAYDLELTDKRRHLFPFILLLLVAIITLIFVNWGSIKQVNKSDVIHVVENNIDKLQQEPLIEPVLTKKNSVDHVVKNNVDKFQNESLIDPDVPKKVSVDTEIEKNTFLKLDHDLVIEKNIDKKISSTLNRIESIRFEVNDTGIDLLMNMPYDIDYLVYDLSNPNRTVIEVENVELGFRLEDLDPVEPIVAIRYSINEYHRFKLVLESDRPLSVRKSTTSQLNDKHKLVVAMEYPSDETDTSDKDEYVLSDIVEKQVQEEQSTVFKGELIKIPVARNTDAYAEKLFQQAYAQYKKNNISESLKLLNMSLDQDASNVNARTTLAMILSQQDNMSLAYSVLNEGLIQFPDQVEWIKMLARLLLKEGKIVEAKNLLSKHTPALVSNTDYYALQAALLQKLNEHNESARIYRDILQVNPLKAVWWMGLGISLESLKRYKDALYAYQKAFNNPAALAIESRDFISQRLSMLNNLLKDEST